MSRGPMPEPVHAPPGDGVRGGHEGVGPVVEVEERRLGALEEHVAPRGELVVEEPDGVGDHRRDPRRVLVEVRAPAISSADIGRRL